MHGRLCADVVAPQCRSVDLPAFAVIVTHVTDIIHTIMQEGIGARPLYVDMGR